MNPSRFLVVIGGPTASGKTEMAIRCALHFQTEVLSADSRQFYREMNIGTAKPTKQELSLVPHHFINSLSIRDEFSVGDFERNAIQLLDKLFQTNQVVVMTGGSGLFIRAVCEGLDVFPDVPEEIHDEVGQLFKLGGVTALQELLNQLDPDYFRQVDIHNPARLLRAVEVCKASGKPYSSFLGHSETTRNFHSIFIQLDWPRDVLYRRINHRVDEMMARGLEAEARELYPFRHLQALQTVGYQELFDYFEEACTLEQAVEKIKQHTRNYAKRQLTWMRKYGHWQPFATDQGPQILQFIQQQMNNPSI